MEYDYYYETLGFIPNETAEILEYSVADNGYVSAENRLIDGTWINSGMIMNKAFKVIPDEEITLRISAGNGKFASKPVTYKIPSAVSAPEKMPVLTKKDGKYYLSGYDYEIAIESDTDISELAEIWGYLDEESYLSAMSKRYGIDDIEKLKKIVGSEWRTDYILDSGQTVAVRKASDDTHFASECKFITISKNGDVNDDGFVDAVDASLVAMHYASLSTNGTGTIDENRLAFADYNEDGLVNAVDASEICIYYAKMSTLNNE